MRWDWQTTSQSPAKLQRNLVAPFERRSAVCDPQGEGDQVGPDGAMSGRIPVEWEEPRSWVETSRQIYCGEDEKPTCRTSIPFQVRGSLQADVQPAAEQERSWRLIQRVWRRSSPSWSRLAAFRCAIRHLVGQKGHIRRSRRVVV